jgi:hypothetical protein
MTAPDPQLDLLALNDEAFKRLYDGRIAPIFAAREVERRAALRAFAWRMIAVVAAALAVIAAVLALEGDLGEGMIWVGVGVFAGFWVAYGPLGAVAQQTKAQSLGAIASAIGCAYVASAARPPEIDRFRSMQLLPRCDRDAYEDRFSGLYRACGYDFCDAHLETKHRTNKGGTRWVTVFRGQVIRIAFPKKFHGETLVLRDAGFFNFLQGKRGLQRVGLGDSRLERAFEVYSNDQVEARYLIHPVFMERLLALEERFRGARLRCAFEGGELLIAIEGKNRFEIGTMFSSLNDPKRAKSVIDDLTEIVRVVDAVLTAELGALPTS